MFVHRMRVSSVCLLIGLCCAPPVMADVTYSKTDDDMTVIRMTVTPAAESTPIFKHRLVARDIDLQAGNAAPYYYRAIADTGRSFPGVLKEFGEDEYYSWIDTGNPWNDTENEGVPLKDLPLDIVQKALSRLDYVADDHLTEAGLCRDCNWELGFESIRGPKIISVRLDDFQSARNIARTLVLRTRYDVARNRFERAIDTIRMNYRLGGDVAKVPILVCGLIGIAIDSMTNSTVIELIAAPDSPNLYWALTALPTPLIDLRDALRFEIDFGPRMFPFIFRAESTDHSPDEWNRLYTQSFRDLAAIGDGSIHATNDLSAGLLATANALANYSFAKSQLIAQGMNADKVEKMSIGQVMAIYTERKYNEFADDFEKLWYVPFPELRERYEAVERRLDAAGIYSGNENREVLPIVAQLLPAMQWARVAQVRLERDMAVLRVIEALRMYAASHAGGLPQSLDEITEVPVPLNPATAKPFVYRLENRTAILDLPDSDGIPSYKRRYEISIAEKD